MVRSLFNVLSNDERIIVYSSEEDECFYTWNQADTLQCWLKSAPCTDDWEAGSTLTKKGHGPKNYKEAMELAIAWHTDSL